MYFTVKVQYYQQTSARRLQCFSRRIASLMVLKQLQKKSMKKEKIRIQHRTAYIKQAIDISLQAAVKTFQKAQHFLTFRKLIQQISSAQQQMQDQMEVNTLLFKERDEYSLSLFTETFVKQAIANIPLPGIDEAYYNSLNQVLRKRMKNEHQSTKEHMWNNEWNIAEKLKHIRTYLNIKNTEKLQRRDFLDERLVLIDSAWRFIDPGRQHAHLNKKQLHQLFATMNFSCSSVQMDQLIEEEGRFMDLTDVTGGTSSNIDRPKKRRNNKNKQEQRNNVLSRIQVQKFILDNTNKEAPYEATNHLTNVNKWKQRLNNFTGKTAKKEADRAIRAVVKEETIEFASWYYDECNPAEMRFDCCLCSSYFSHFKQWHQHIQTCVGQDEEHERYKHRSVSFRCAYDVLQTLPLIYIAAIQHADVVSIREIVSWDEGEKKGAPVGEKDTCEDDTNPLVVAAAATAELAWKKEFESSMEQEYEDWVEYQARKKKERIEARLVRRTARELRRNKRHQHALNKKWQENRDMLQRRVDQLNRERVFVPGAGVDGRFGTTVKDSGD